MGNNVAARARSMAWYIEKGLNGYQTITDGTTFNMNEVIKTTGRRRHNMRAEYLTDIPKHRKQHNIALGPLGERGRKRWSYRIEDKKLITKGASREDIEEMTMNHLKEMFTEIGVISQYKLEIKEIVERVTLNGASNYQTKIENAVQNTKMRSYKDKSYRRKNGGGSIPSECSSKT